jgi:hypothetical protein
MLRKLGNRNIALGYIVAMSAVAAATTALIFSLVVRDLQIGTQPALWAICVTCTGPWTRSGVRLLQVESVSPLILIGGAAMLIGGIVFSLLKTQRPVPSASARKLARQYQAFEADLARIETEQLLEQSTSCDEPYPHHETYPESAGEDQGQLTSHLPGSTPFLEG